jgi:hypothetical protein
MNWASLASMSSCRAIVVCTNSINFDSHDRERIVNCAGCSSRLDRMDGGVNNCLVHPHPTRGNRCHSRNVTEGAFQEWEPDVTLANHETRVAQGIRKRTVTAKRAEVCWERISALGKYFAKLTGSCVLSPRASSSGRGHSVVGAVLGILSQNTNRGEIRSLLLAKL